MLLVDASDVEPDVGRPAVGGLRAVGKEGMEWAGKRCAEKSVGRGGWGGGGGVGNLEVPPPRGERGPLGVRVVVPRV